MKRLRCCGRFCFWRPPFGPWCCATCERQRPGQMPKNAEHRFWEAVDAIVANLPPVDPELLALFRRAA